MCDFGLPKTLRTFLNQGYITPLFAFFFSDRVVYPERGTTLLDSSALPLPSDSDENSDSAVSCWLKSLGYRVLDSLLAFAFKNRTEVLVNSDPPVRQDKLLEYYPCGRLGFVLEGAGKQRIFAIPNALKQALLRPAHEWCMEVLRSIPMDGTFNQTAPLSRLSKVMTLHSFDLSAATDRFPLLLQFIVVKCLFSIEAAFAWVYSGLGVNVFLAPARGEPGLKFVPFGAGQPLGYLSSWPLFALCHHILVWYAAEQVYPGRRFTRYALLGDDIVIGDARVASVYKEVISDFGVKISTPKSLISNRGGLEFAKKFRILDRDLSPVSVKMLRAAQSKRRQQATALLIYRCADARQNLLNKQRMSALARKPLR